MQFNTTVEDLSKYQEKWKLTLRKRNILRDVDIRWEDIFDAVVLANGHYSTPYVLARLAEVGEGG